MLDFLPLPPHSDAVATATTAPRTWDVFCQVIDNFGDVGVCWRAARELVARGQTVRLWMDDASALQWMAPAPHPQGLTVHPWPTTAADVPARVGDVVVEAFGCEIPAVFLQAIAQQAAAGQPPVWINLEYLSAEDYVARCHRLPSRLMSGPASGLTRWFFYPGFTPDTGGLIAEQSLPERQTTFDRHTWRTAHGLQDSDCAISLFCYEPPALPQLLGQLLPAQHSAPYQADWQPQLLVTPGRATAAVAAAQQANPLYKTIADHALAACPQPQFDEMLWACDLNLVRGEDSLVRALWAGQPFVWHIYPQHDDAHHAKLNAFLDWLQAPAALRSFHHAWNGLTPADSLPRLTPDLLRQWQTCTLAARQKLQVQTDLIGQLLQFVAEKS